MIQPAMNKALKWVEFLGNFTFCIPHDKVIPKQQLFWKLDSTSLFLLVIHVLIASLPFIFLLDTVLSNSFEVITGNPRFSEQIGLLSVYGAMTAFDFIIKLSGLIFVEDLRFLLLILKNKKCSTSPSQCCFTITSLGVASVVAVGYGVAIVMIQLNYEFSPEYNLALVPKSSRLYLTVYLVSTVWAVLSLLYSWLFIILVGMTLIGLLEDYSSSCLHIITTCKMNQLEDLGTEFDLLKKLFDSFGRIGGVYCLALLGINTLILVRFLSGISDPGESKVAFQPGTQFYCYLVPVAIMIIAGLGSWLSSKVEQHSNVMQGIVSRVSTTNGSFDKIHLHGFVYHQVNWKWKLTGLGLFKIRASLIPGLVTTVLTYFILLYQLRSSEMRSELQASGGLT